MSFNYVGQALVDGYVEFASRYKFDIFLTLTTMPRRGDSEKIMQRFEKENDKHLRFASVECKNTLNAMGLIIYDRIGHLHSHIFIGQKSCEPITDEQKKILGKWRYESKVKNIYQLGGVAEYVFSIKHMHNPWNYMWYAYGTDQLIRQNKKLIENNKKLAA